jgi:hypothetical protein
MNGINTTIKSVSKTPTLNTALQLGQQAAIAASASVLGVNRGILDLAATGANQLAEKLSYGTPGFSIASLDQLLRAQGHQAGGKKAAEESTVAQLQSGERDAFGNLPEGVKELAEATFTDTVKKQAKDAQQAKINSGDLLLVGGEYLDAKTLNMHDFSKLKQEFGQGSKFSKESNGYKLQIDTTKSASFNDQQFKDLLAGKDVKLKIGSDTKETTFSFKDGKLTLKAEDAKDATEIKDHGLDKITYGDSKLNAEGHRIANARLGFLAEGNDVKGAQKLDTLLKGVKDALKDSPLKDDAHTLSYLAGKFAKLENGEVKLDTAALTTALRDTKFTQQLEADKALRDKPVNKGQAQEINKTGYNATKALFAQQQDLNAAATAQGFTGANQHRNMAGSAELASNKAYADLTGEKPALLEKLKSATADNPVKLSFNFMGFGTAEADAKGAYKDSSRGADGGLSTLATLDGPLAGKVNEIQLGSAGLEGLKKNLTAVKDFLNNEETQGLIKAGKLQVEGLALALHAHGNKQLVALGDKNLDAEALKEVSGLMKEIYTACGQKPPSDIGITFNSCEGHDLANGVAQEIFKHAGTNYAGRVTADGTKGFTKLSGDDAAHDDSNSQFAITSNGSVIRTDRYSNDGTKYSFGNRTLESSTDRAIFQNTTARSGAASANGVAGLITQGDRTDVGVPQRQANQAASNAGGVKPDDPKRDGAGCLEPQESPANDEWKKQTAAVS